MNLIIEKFSKPEMKNLEKKWSQNYEHIESLDIDDYIDFKTQQIINILKNEKFQALWLEQQKELEDSIVSYWDFILDLKKNLKNVLEIELQLDYKEKLTQDNIWTILGQILKNVRNSLNHDHIFFELSEEYLDKILEKTSKLVEENENCNIGDLIKILNKNVFDNLYNFLYIYSKELKHISLNTNNNIELFYNKDNINIYVWENSIWNIVFPKDYNKFLKGTQEENLEKDNDKDYDIIPEKSETNYLKKISKQIKEEEKNATCELSNQFSPFHK